MKFDELCVCIKTRRRPLIFRKISKVNKNPLVGMFTQPIQLVGWYPRPYNSLSTTVQWILSIHIFGSVLHGFMDLGMDNHLSLADSSSFQAWPGKYSTWTKLLQPCSSLHYPASQYVSRSTGGVSLCSLSNPYFDVTFRVLLIGLADWWLMRIKKRQWQW